MAHAVDGNSEIGANVRSNLCSLISLRHLIGSKTLTNRILKKKTFAFMREQHVLSYHLTCAPWQELSIDYTLHGPSQSITNLSGLTKK